MSNLYEIGVRMTMYENVSPVLTALAHHFLHLHHTIDRATAAAWKFRTAVAGAAAAFAGIQIGKGVVSAIEHGNKLVAVQNQMTAAGWKYKEIQEATAKAWELTAKHQSIGAAEILAMQKEMAPVLGDRHHAVEMAGQMTKLMVAFQGAFGVDSAAKFHTQVRDAIRAGELSANVLQPERFEKYLDGMAKTLKAFGGTITPSDYFMATKYGRAGAINWNDEFTNLILPTIMQELGASSTGTGLMTLYQAVVGGRMRLRSINMFDRMGLIDQSKLNTEDLTAEGRIKRMSPGAIRGSRMLMENPFEWVWQVMIPAFLDKGVISQAGLDAIKQGKIKDGIGKEARKAMTETIAIMFGDRTAQGIVDLLALQWKKIMRDKKLIGEAMGLDEGTKFFESKQYEMATIAFHEQWDNLMTALGSPSVQMATDTIKGFTSVLADVAQVFAANPTLSKAVLVGLGVLAASLVAIGTAMLALAVFGGAGLIVAGLAAVTAFLATLAALNWGKIKSFASGVATGFQEFFVGRDEYVDEKGGFHARKKGIFQTIQGIVAEFINRIATIPGMLAAGIQSMANAIASKINAALGWVGSLLNFGGGGGNPIQKQSFTPPAGGGGIQQIRASINVDGRQLASAVSYHQARSGSHVRSSAGFDGVRSHTPVDYSFA